jgi:prohibitin 2
MSGGFPKNFQELQRTLQNAQQQGRKMGGGFGGGGNPRNALGGLLGLVVVGGGAVLLSNSLFNGTWMEELWIERRLMVSE